MASPDDTDAIIGFGPGSFIDDCSLRQTPYPQAASTDFRTSVNTAKNLPQMQNRLGQSMSFLKLPDGEDMEQSSMGLLPCNLDASLMNFSSVPLSVSLNKSRKHSTLPSIPESPRPPLSSPDSNEVNSDNVFYDGNDIEDDKNERLTIGSRQPTPMSMAKDKFSISDLSKIEFRDDQISARSSTGHAEDDQPVAKTFSQLFNKYSLDITDFMANEFKSVCNDDEVRKSDASDGDGEFFHEFGEPLTSGLSADDDEFKPAEDCLNDFKDAEEVLQQENNLKIPEKTSSEGEKETAGHTSSRLSASWVATASDQDVPWPSWATHELDASLQSRISFGQFIGLKTEALGKLDASVLSNVERPHFGIRLSPPVNKDNLEIPVNETRPITSVKAETSPNVSSKLGIPNNSTINNLLSEVSLSVDYKKFAEVFVQASAQGKFDKAPKPIVERIEPPRTSSDALTNRGSDGSGASSTLTSIQSTESSHTESLHLKKVGTTEMEDKFVQVDFKNDLPSIRIRDVRPDFPEGSVQSTNFTGEVLRHLQADAQDFRQSIIVPGEINISERCCVGTSIDTTLRLNNPSARWLECGLRIQMLTCNGRTWNVDTVPPFLGYKSCWMLEPNAPHLLKMVIIPPAEGNWEALLQLFVRNLSSMATKGTGTNEWHPYPLIPLKVTAETPCVDTAPASLLDFGLLPEECLLISHIQVTNNGKSKIPIRLVIEGSLTSGQGFYFPQETAAATPALHTVSSCILSCILEKELSSIKVPIAFKAQILPHGVDTIQTVCATLRIELDVPGPTPLLRKVALRALVGPVKLCTKEETIELSYPASFTKSIPLQNVGSIPLKLNLATDEPRELSVVPQDVELMPGQSVQVQLIYHPTDISNSIESFLKIQVLPGGSFYKIKVVGTPQNYPPLVQALRPGNHLSLHSDRRYLYWGTVDLGCFTPQQFTLRNVSPTEQLFLSLKVKMDDGSGDAVCPFQLVDETSTTVAGLSSMSPPSCRFVPHKNVTLQPGEEQVIKVYFSPRKSTHFSGKLVIRPRRMAHSLAAGSNAWVKFTIPLRGYGGIAIVTFDGLQPSHTPSPSHFCAPTSTSPHIVSTTAHNTIHKINCDSNGGVLHFSAKNVGQRAAFLKILVSSDKNSIVPLPNLLGVTVQPSEFVLSEGTCRAVKVTIQPHSNFTQTFYLILFHGEEVLRQRFRLLQIPLGENPIDSFVRAQLKLNDNFLNEIPLHSPNPPVSDPLWPSCHADRTQLLASLKTVWVFVQPTVRASTSRTSMYSTSSSVADLDEDHPNGVFVPLDAEETFSDVTLVARNAPSSPPSKERTYSMSGNEGVIQVEANTLAFAPTQCGQSSISKVMLKNVGSGDSIMVNIVPPSPPFHVNYNQVNIKAKHYLSFPVMFRPSSTGTFSSTLHLHYRAGPDSVGLSVALQGTAY